MPDETTYEPIPPECAGAFNVAANVIGDWAKKKGWNNPPDEKQLIDNQDLALMMLALKPVVAIMELIRKGESIPKEYTQLVIILGLTNPTEYNMTELQARKLSQMALMVTEIYESAEGVLNNTNDDHTPELTSESAEMADIFIRALHYCSEHRLHIGKAITIKHNYNTKRPYRHGNKAA